MARLVFSVPTVVDGHILTVILYWLHGQGMVINTSPDANRVRTMMRESGDRTCLDALRDEKALEVWHGTAVPPRSKAGRVSMLTPTEDQSERILPLRGW
jgi:hypothetical protein